MSVGGDKEARLIFSLMAQCKGEEDWRRYNSTYAKAQAKMSR